jgi:cysteine-rich repeat protein
MRPTARFWFAAAWVASLGCGDDDGFKLPNVQSVSVVVSDDDNRTDRVAECDGAEVGQACGQAGGQFHCVLNVCVRNACGDGVAAELEECDDGNERDNDGCDSHCHKEAANAGTGGRAGSGGAAGSKNAGRGGNAGS